MEIDKHGGALRNIYISNIQPPKAYKLYIDFSIFEEAVSPDGKHKRVIIIDRNETHLAYVVINSEVNFKIHPIGSYTLDFQYELKFIDNQQVVDRDSYVNCSNIYTLDIGKLADNFDSNAPIPLGNVATADYESIIALVAKCTKIKRVIKKTFPRIRREAGLE